MESAKKKRANSGRLYLQISLSFGESDFGSESPGYSHSCGVRFAQWFWGAQTRQLPGWSLLKGVF